jgi:hypothetical protein
MLPNTEENMKHLRMADNPPEKRQRVMTELRRAIREPAVVE